MRDETGKTKQKKTERNVMHSSNTWKNAFAFKFIKNVVAGHLSQRKT